MTKKKEVGKNRSAVTGQYITEREAQKDPKHSVHETDKSSKPKPVSKPKPAPKKGK